MASKSRPFEKEVVDSSETAFAITPHNTNELPNITKRIYVGGAGDVRVTMADGNAVTFTAVAAGTILPVRASKVLTATTATNLVGLA